MQVNPLRDELQEKWASEFIAKSSGRGILHLCPRAGKTRTTIRIFCKVHRIIKRRPKILVAYPDKNIQTSWKEDIQEVKYFNPDIEYTTHKSLEKVVKNHYDIIVCDEVHLLSDYQIMQMNQLLKTNQRSVVICLSGTLSTQTKMKLFNSLGFRVIAEYTLDQAVKDGLISDYRIHVIATDLDTKQIVDVEKNKTEKKLYNSLTWVIENRNASFFLLLKRMRLLQNSIAKTRKTKDLLKILHKERVLVFCPGNKVAKELGCKVHTAKIGNQEEFEKFIKNQSTSNHYAVCKIGNTGVSFKNLKNIIISAFDSNGENLAQRICRSLILDEKHKVSNIYIVTTTEEVELNWLKSALSFFDSSKIDYGAVKDHFQKKKEVNQ